ncbi:MAG: hypothetical protein IPL32_20335 [Chloracidobacterium sp.]|nr:hypothetical protein [Chloracidobacterium sp.]
MIFLHVLLHIVFQNIPHLLLAFDPGLKDLGRHFLPDDQSPAVRFSVNEVRVSRIVRR